MTELHPCPTCTSAWLAYEVNRCNRCLQSAATSPESPADQTTWGEPRGRSFGTGEGTTPAPVRITGKAA